MSEAGNIPEPASTAPVATPRVHGASSTGPGAVTSSQVVDTKCALRIQPLKAEKSTFCWNKGFHFTVAVRALSGHTADELRRVEDNVVQDFSIERLSEAPRVVADTFVHSTGAALQG